MPVRDELLTRLDECQRRLAQALLNRVRHARTRLKGARLRLTDPRRLVRDRMLRLDDRTERLIRAMHTTLRHARTRLDADRRRLVDPRRTLAARRARLTHLESRLVAAMKGQVRHLRAHHRALARALKTLSPTAVLDRGYAIVRQPAGGVVRSWRDVTEGQTVAVLLGDGGMDAVVAAVRADDAARKEDH